MQWKRFLTRANQGKHKKRECYQYGTWPTCKIQATRSWNPQRAQGGRGWVSWHFRSQFETLFLAWWRFRHHKTLRFDPQYKAQRLHRIAQSSDEVIRSIVKQEGIEKEFEKLWVTAGGDKNKIPSIWDLSTIGVTSEELSDEEPASEWELSAPQIIFA